MYNSEYSLYYNITDEGMLCLMADGGLKYIPNKKLMECGEHGN